LSEHIYIAARDALEMTIAMMLGTCILGAAFREITRGTVTGAGSDRVSEIENVDGSPFADVIVGKTSVENEYLRLSVLLYRSKRRSTREALCPPKPNELETATWMSASRASLGM
jgi:hypothetical protein